MDDCLGRSKTALGSSKGYPPTAGLGGGYFSSDAKENPLMANWNKVGGSGPRAQHTLLAG